MSSKNSLNVSENEKLSRESSTSPNPKNPAIQATAPLIKSNVPITKPSRIPPKNPMIELKNVANIPSLLPAASFASKNPSNKDMITCSGKNNLAKKLLNTLKNVIKTFLNLEIPPSALEPLALLLKISNIGLKKLFIVFPKFDNVVLNLVNASEIVLNALLSVKNAFIEVTN